LVFNNPDDTNKLVMLFQTDSMTVKIVEADVIHNACNVVSTLK